MIDDVPDSEGAREEQRRATWNTLAILLVALLACACAAFFLGAMGGCVPTQPPVDAATQPCTQVVQMTIGQGRCTVLELQLDGGVSETLCVTAQEMADWFDARAGRK